MFALADGCRSQAEATHSPDAPPATVSDAPTEDAAGAEPVEVEPPAVFEPEAVTEAPAVVTLESLGPFYDAAVVQGWLMVVVDSDDPAWRRLATGSFESMWAGNPAIPEVVETIPPIHFVWSGGVVRRDKYTRVGPDLTGWRLEYRPKGIKNPVLGMGKAPAEGASIRPGAKVKRIRGSHPMAVRMAEILATEFEPDRRPRRRLKDFQLQITPGRFGAADRVVAVSAWVPPVLDQDVGDDFGVLFTADEDLNLVRLVDPLDIQVEVVGLVDVDGDGVDEIITLSHGYETASREIRRLTPSGVEMITFWEHDE